MKPARLITTIGSIVLFVTGCLHGSGYTKVVAALSKEHMQSEILPSVLKTCWLAFSMEMMALAVIAFVAASLERGGVIVLLCGLTNAANGVLLLHFLGPFVGVYLVVIVTLLFGVGGWLQIRAASVTA